MVAVIVRDGPADYLSTLALALAVIAFIVQIVVFIGQSAASGQQLARAEELHGLTTRALATIEEKSEGTRRDVSTMNERLLEAALGKVLPRAEAAGVSPASPEVAAEVVNMLRRQSASRRNVGEGNPRQRRQQRSQNERAVLPVPSGNMRDRAIEALSKLNGSALDTLETLARDYETYGNRPEGRIGHGILGIAHGQELYDAGLVSRRRVAWEDDPVWVLTDLGIAAGAMLTSDSLSDSARALSAEARAKLSEYHAQMARLLGRNEHGGIPVEGDED